MRRISVVQVNKCYHPWIGGVEKVCQDIAEGLKEYVDMKVLVCQPKGKGVKEVINNIPVYKASSFGIFFSMPVSLEFPSLLKKLSKDTNIIHFHSPFPLGELSSLIFRIYAKFVVTWHSDIVRQKNFFKIYRPFLLRFLKNIDRIIVTNPNTLNNSEVLSSFKEKCEVIPLGINLNKFEIRDDQRELVEKIRWKYGPNIVLFVGRLTYYKGLEFLIDAMKDIQGTLLIVGNGVLRIKLQELANKLGIEKKVYFLGWIPEDELIPLYHACDVFVLPSTHNSEVFGIVQLEAMACRKPVINTSLPTGVPYVSLDGITGITVPPRDSKALAGAINKILKDKNLRIFYGENARRRVEAEFTLEKMCNRVLKVYNELVP